MRKLHMESEIIPGGDYNYIFSGPNDKETVLFEVSKTNSINIDLCLSALLLNKNLIILDKDSSHIKIEEAGINFEKTCFLSDTKLAITKNNLSQSRDIEPSFFNQCSSYIMLFTSGSTGKPKCVKLRPKLIVESASLFCSWAKIDATSKVFSLAPMSSMSGVRSALFLPIVSQCEVSFNTVKNNNIFDYILRIKNEKLTHFIVGPPFIKSLALLSKRIDNKEVASLKFILCTGAMLSKKDVDQIYQNLSIKVLNYYGLTETYGFCIAQPYYTPDFESNNIGMPIEGVEIEIEDENSLGIGKLIIRSERLYDGYLGKKSHNCDSYVTGDLAKINKNGEVLLYGRADDAINLSSTELVYPFDIEEILISSPLVFDAKVIKHEQSWKAIIASNTDKSELFEHFNDLFLSKYIPQNFTVVDSIKQNPLGKISKVFLEEK